MGVQWPFQFHRYETVPHLTHVVCALGTAPALTARCSQALPGRSDWPQQATKWTRGSDKVKTSFNVLLKLKTFTKFSTNTFSSSMNLDCFGLLLPQTPIIYFIYSLLWWDLENPVLQLTCVAGTCLWAQGKGSPRVLSVELSSPSLPWTLLDFKDPVPK